MKTTKKAIIVLIFLLCIGLLYHCINKAGEKMLSENEVNKYMKYTVSITENTTKKDLLDLCYEVGNETINEEVWTIYKSDLLTEYSYDAGDVINVDECMDKLYVTYTTSKNQNIALCYTDAGFQFLSFYDEKKIFL